LVTGKNGIQITNWKSETVGFFNRRKTLGYVTF